MCGRLRSRWRRFSAFLFVRSLTTRTTLGHNCVDSYVQSAVGRFLGLADYGDRVCARERTEISVAAARFRPIQGYMYVL